MKHIISIYRNIWKIPVSLPVIKFRSWEVLCQPLSPTQMLSLFLHICSSSQQSEMFIVFYTFSLGTVTPFMTSYYVYSSLFYLPVTFVLIIQRSFSFHHLQISPTWSYECNRSVNTCIFLFSCNWPLKILFIGFWGVLGSLS